MQQVCCCMQFSGIFIALSKTAFKGAFLFADLLMFFKRLIETVCINSESLLCSHLLGKLKRESVCVIQAESLFTADLCDRFCVRIIFRCFFVVLTYLSDTFAELLHTSSQSHIETVSFLHDLFKNVVFFLNKKRIGFIIDLFNEDAAAFCQYRRVKSELSGVAHCSAQQTAKDISGSYVRRNYSVHISDKHRGCADVVSHYAHRFLCISVFIIIISGSLFQMLDHRPKEVCFVSVSKAV